MPTLNLDVTDAYSIQNSIPGETPVTIQNAGSNPIELYFGASLPAETVTGIVLVEGETAYITVSSGEACYAKTLENGALSFIVVVH